MAWNLFEAMHKLIEDGVGILSEPRIAVARGSAKNAARAYHLDGDDDAFRALWFLMIKASMAEKYFHAAAEKEVVGCLDALKRLVDKAPARPTASGWPITVVKDDGFHSVQIADSAGRYVVFSDHHMLPHGARQNFFKHGYRAEKMEGVEKSNYALYLEILRDYYGVSEYTLVENGDVEELLIFEPKMSEIGNIDAWSWDQIIKFRHGKKKSQLAQIAEDNREYYETIFSSFISKQKYFRITGNHDRDMREPEFASLVTAATGVAMPLASDVLLLRGAQGVEYVICHGHQFDTSCTPAYAAQLGESFAQSSAWAYQGPDRVWRERLDPIAEWRAGTADYHNELVTDAVTDWETTFEQVVKGFDPVTGEHSSKALQFLADALCGAIGELDSERGWEGLYGKNVAWEYFDNASSPKDAIRDEVKTGRRWFKFRHMNEFLILNGLESRFGDRPPKLILGHSHEPRFRPGYNLPGVDRRQVEFYLNSGSAGRYENLIWGIELIDGEPFMISWHREDRDAGSAPIRTIWEDAYTGSVYVLRPVSTATIPELLAEQAAGLDLTLIIATEHAL